MLPDELIIGLLLAPLVVPFVAARTRDLRATTMLAIWSAVPAVAVVIAIWWVVQHVPQGAPFIVRWLVYDLGVCHWYTLSTLVWAVTLSCLHPPLRAGGFSLSLLPLTVWGFESATNHIFAFEAFHPTYQLILSRAIASVVALALLLVFVVVWRRHADAGPVRSTLFPSAVLVVSTVLIDWGFALYAWTRFPRDF